MVHPRREDVRTLRRAGKSYNEITELTGVSKSSIHYMVADIVLPAKVLWAIEQRGNAKALAALARMSREARHVASSLGGYAAQEKLVAEGRKPFGRA